MKKLISIFAIVLVLFSSMVFLVNAKTVAPNAPSKVTATVTKTSINVKWSKVNGADGYRIYYKTPTVTSWKTWVSSTAKTTHTFKKFNAGEKYTIAVRSYKKASDKSVVWGKYKTVTAITQPAATAKITATQSISAIKLTWRAVKGATHYRVYQKVGSNWKSLGYTTKLTKTIKNLVDGTDYAFRVCSYIKHGDKMISGSYASIVTATKPVAPAAIKATVTEKTVKLSWSKVRGADGYRIYYKNSKNASWKAAVSSMTGTSKTFGNLSSGTTYYFAVKPYVKTSSGVVWGDYTSIKTKTAQYEEEPTTQEPEIGSAVWIPINGGTKYHNNPECSNMTNPQQVSVDEAVRRGYTPCKKCYN